MQHDVRNVAHVVWLFQSAILEGHELHLADLTEGVVIYMQRKSAKACHVPRYVMQELVCGHARAVDLVGCEGLVAEAVALNEFLVTVKAQVSRARRSRYGLHVLRIEVVVTV